MKSKCCNARVNSDLVYRENGDVGNLCDKCGQTCNVVDDTYGNKFIAIYKEIEKGNLKPMEFSNSCEGCKWEEETFKIVGQLYQDLVQEAIKKLN